MRWNTHARGATGSRRTLALLSGERTVTAGGSTEKEATAGRAFGKTVGSAANRSSSLIRRCRSASAALANALPSRLAMQGMRRGGAGVARLIPTGRVDESSRARRATSRYGSTVATSLSIGTSWPSISVVNLILRKRSITRTVTLPTTGSRTWNFALDGTGAGLPSRTVAPVPVSPDLRVH